MTGNEASFSASGEDAYGNKVEIEGEATMNQGTFNTVKEMNVESGDTTISHSFDATKALTGSALSAAQTSDDDKADNYTRLGLAEGSFNAYQDLRGDGVAATITHNIWATKTKTDSAGSWARDSDDNKGSAITV